MPVLDAIVPAGGTLREDFAKVVGVDRKALIRFEDKPLIQRVLEALRAAPSVGRVVVIGAEEVEKAIPAGLADAVLPEGTSGPDNIDRAIRWYQQSLQEPERVLIVTADLPFLTPQSIEDFVAKVPPEADIAAPLITKEAFEDMFPMCDALFVKLREGPVTLGCAYVVKARTCVRCKPHIEEAFARRKSKIGMASLLGLPFVYKWLVGSLSVADVERKVAEVLHCKPVAVRDAPPELAFDVDYPDDYAYALGVFEEKLAKPHP
ncbi:MAG TPA: hypothetical protein DER07_08545 [Armatimonadetes bacterium]|nr:hypothetical protein [Armatimonadota bacterium]